MVKFMYPADKFNEKSIDKNIILELILKHRSTVSKMHKNLKYYNGEHDIEHRTRSNNAPNNKVMCNHAKDIVDTATGYFMGNPITYKNSGDDNIEPLLEAFDKANVDDLDSANAQDMSIFGVAYEYVYAKKDESVPTVRNISPINTFMVIDDSIEENELCGVYYYEKRNDIDGSSIYVATVATKKYKYVLNIDNDIKAENKLTETPEEHYFKEIPIVEYLNNKGGIGDFEQQISLIDAYNTLTSDRVNDKDQFIDALLILYGVVLGDDEEAVTKAAEKLRQEKILELPMDAKAEYLTRMMDEQGVEVLRKAIKEDIYTFSHVPNLSDENFVGNSSGVAMEFKLLGLEMITMVKTRYYKQGLRKRIKLFCNFLNLKELALESGSVMASFSRALPKNLQEIAQVVTNLKGTVSQQKLLSLLPFIEDPDDEVEKVAKENEENIRLQKSIFEQGSNDPPEENNDSESDPSKERLPKKKKGVANG